MPHAHAETVGQELEAQLLKAIHAAEEAPLPGARDLPVLRGIDRSGNFLVSQENVLVQAARILVETGSIYSYGDSVVMEIHKSEGLGAVLVPLRIGSIVESSAKDFLANVFVCQHGKKQFPPQSWFVSVLLRAQSVLEQLPRIKLYAKRPVFDDNFVLHGPGWHADVGILVHGPEIEPVLEVIETNGTALERLPHNLQTLLRGFCFRTDADLVNAIAMMLTGLLTNHFLVRLKALGLVDGNQPGLGKTLLVRVIGIILDNADPRLIHFTEDDEELQKRICATLRDGRQSVLLIDNAKVKSGGVVSSPAIEANSMAPEISLRILGKSENYSRPNDILWFLTMNDTKTSPDLVSRGNPIQLSHEGKPEDRVFAGPDPITYAREHRLNILGELAGMIVRWNQLGRPPGQLSHRLHDWAHMIGGILGTAGLPEFLQNAGTAATTFSSALDELAALAEAVVRDDGPFITVAHPEEGERKLSPREWEAFFRKADVRVEDLDQSKSSRSRAIKIGQFLTPNVNREVPIEVNGRTGMAVLRVAKERAKEKRYYFEITWDNLANTQVTEDKPQSTKPKNKKTENSPKPSTKGNPKAKDINLTKLHGKRTQAKRKPIKNKPTRKQGTPTKPQGGGNDLDW